MGRSSSDRAGRWPWGVWFALVGVSAGTVASFALVGWTFVSLAGQGADEAAEAPVWAGESVVLEAAPEPGSAPAPGPSDDHPLVSEPEAGLIPGPEPEPEPEPTPQTEDGPPVESGTTGQDPRLVPLPPPEPEASEGWEDRRECGLEIEATPEPIPSDTPSTPTLELEHEFNSLPRPKE